MRLTPKYLYVLSVLSLAACNPDVRFSEIPISGKTSVEIPSVEVPPVVVVPTPTPTPTPTPEPEPEPVYNKNSGPCAGDSSTAVTSGMKCLVPVLPHEEPPMSLKAQRLMASMTTACTMYNKSYGSNYKAPVSADHLAKLNRCSAQTYKDTSMTSAQSTTITKLASGDATLTNKMFSGLWYQPPYSDHFETYFGIAVNDVVRVFCLQDLNSFPTIVYPIGYYDHVGDPNYQMPQNYVLANQYLNSLRSCLSESLSNPWKPGPPPPAKTCSFETFSGPAGAPINAKVAEWLGKGQKVSADILNQGKTISLTNVDQLHGYTGDILVGTYTCQ